MFDVRNKSEDRNPKRAPRSSVFGFPFTIGFPSDCGFRISDFPPDTRHSTLDTYSAYAQTVSRKKNMLKTSFRSATHATDSTRRGCSPKKAATTKLRQIAPVARFKTRKSRTVFAQWSMILPKWCPQAFKPKILQSNVCESQVIGCQL